MAYTKKTTTKAVENTNTDVAEKKSEKKKFEPTEMIPCVSLTAGELFYVGLKSDTLYTNASAILSVSSVKSIRPSKIRSISLPIFTPYFLV